MTLGLLGKKVGMTQVYDEQGKIAPVTVLQVGPCPVLQVRDQKRDGYDAVQLGYLDKPRRKATRAERGHVSAEMEAKRRRARAAAGVTLPPKANCEPQRHIKEFRLDAPPSGPSAQVGSILTVAELFKNVKHVDVVGTTKGRGYAGTMKRWNMAGLPAAHGAKKVHRSHGSVGSLASNRGSGRPKKGKHMPGQYGNAQRTVRNLRVVKVDADHHLLLVEGGIPGPNGGFILVRPTNKKD
jgi:large subunit ribosomal protein L3